jgi:hypothetical protein
MHPALACRRRRRGIGTRTLPLAKSAHDDAGNVEARMERNWASKARWNEEKPKHLCSAPIILIRFLFLRLFAYTPDPDDRLRTQ